MKVLSPRSRLPLILSCLFIVGLVWGSVVQAQTFDSTYRARSGDTHQSIAARHGISVALLHSLNPYVAIYRHPTPGTVYLVPTAALIGPIPRGCQQLHTVNPGESLAWVGNAYHVPLAELARINNLNIQSPCLHWPHSVPANLRQSFRTIPLLLRPCLVLHPLWEPDLWPHWWDLGPAITTISSNLPLPF